jgi:outer membrane protein OmpA-like peptidoglycan-associated protein
MPPNFTGSKSYLNYSYGFKYKFTTQRLQFETGISAYNITNPWGWNFMPQSDYRKRYRVDALTSFTYAYNAKNSYRLQHYSWKEGIYLTYYYPVQDDTTEIHETTYSLTWLRTNEKHPWSLGLYSRSWEAVYAVFGYNITKGFGLSVSYEAPIYRPYYSLSHFEVSTTIIPYGKKEREKLAPTPEEIVANRVSLMPFNSTECAPATKIETVRLVNMDTIRALVREAIQCPKDTDGDGIPDNIDKCPTVYGSIYNGGCPLDDKRDKPVEVNKIIAAIPSETDAPDTAKFTVYFDYDIYVLNSTAFTVTNQLVAFLRTHNQYRVSLVGLASLEGESEYNMKLSRRRVNSVATYLMSYGIDEKKISISYAGNKLARITSPDRENRWPDRKVEVYLIADGGK